MNSQRQESKETIETQIVKLKNQIEKAKNTPYSNFPNYSPGVPGNDGVVSPFILQQAEKHRYIQSLESKLKQLVALKANIDKRNMNLPSDAQTQQQIASIEQQLKEGKEKLAEPKSIETDSKMNSQNKVSAKQRLEWQKASMKAYNEAKKAYREAEVKPNKYMDSEDTALLEKYKSIKDDPTKLIDKIIFFKNYINKDNKLCDITGMFGIKESYKPELDTLEQMLADYIGNQHQDIKDQPEAINNQINVAGQGFLAAQRNNHLGTRQLEIYYQTEKKVLEQMLSETLEKNSTARNTI